MTWQIAITVAAIGLLALLHVAFAPPAGPPVAGGQPTAAAGASWGRWLALAAIAAAAIALAALIVPAVFGGSSSSTSSTHSTIPSTTTQPTTTRHTTTTAHDTTSTTQHMTTTTRATGTGVTTRPGQPPKGSAALVGGIVTGTGQLAVVQNRLGGAVTVSRVSPGVYRIELSDLSAESRRKSVVRVSAGPRTTAVGGWSADGHLVVMVSDKQTGAPAERPFRFVVLGPRQSAALHRTS